MGIEIGTDIFTLWIILFQLLAEIFLDFLMGRDDYLRSLRLLLREIVRAVKHDMNFSAFTLALMRDHVDSKFRESDPIIRVSSFVCRQITELQLCGSWSGYGLCNFSFIFQFYI